MPLAKIILLCCFYLALIRGTKVGLFYPSEEQALGDIDYTFQIVLNYTLLLGLMTYFFLNNNYRTITGLLGSAPTALIVAACAFSVMFSGDRTQAAKFTVAVFSMSMPLALYWQEFGKEKLVRGLARFAVLMAFVNLAYVLALPAYGMMSGLHAGAWRGMFEHKNGAGPFFGIAFFFILDQIKKHAFRNVLIPLAALAICLLFVVMSHSTTAVVGFLFMALMYTSLLVVLRLSKPLERIMLLLAVIGGGIALYFMAGDAVMGLFFDATGKDATFTGRTNVWRELLALSYNRPLFGYGLGMAQRPEFMAQVQGAIGFEAKSSHNAYLDLILNIGYPGAMLFVVVLLGRLITTLGRLYEYVQDLRMAALGGSIVLMLLVIAFTTADVFIGRSIFWLYLFMGLLLIAPAKKRN